MEPGVPSQHQRRKKDTDQNEIYRGPQASADKEY